MEKINMVILKRFLLRMAPAFFLTAFLLCGFSFYGVQLVRASSTIPYALSGTYVGDGTTPRAITGLGFQPEVVMIKIKTATPLDASSDAQTVMRTSTMDNGTVDMAANPATGLIANAILSLDDNGFTIGDNARVNSNGVNYYWVAFRSDEHLEQMSVGTYVGDGQASRGVSGMNFLPDYVVVINNSGATTPKHRSRTMSWGHSFFPEVINNTRITALTDPDNFSDHNYGFTVGNSTATNGNGVSYSYIAWKEVSGSMITGSYVGNNTASRDIIGLGFQPEILFVTPEAGGAGSDWRSASLVGTDTLSFNIFAIVTNQILALINDGFTIGNHARVNGGQTYHYMAWSRAVPPAITTTELSRAEVTAEYSQHLEASGGDGTYPLWALSSGSLPDGLSINAATGEISGTPTTVGVYNFGVTVVSADQPSAEKSLSITVVSPSVVTTSALAGGEAGLAYSQTLQAAGGTGTYTTWTVSAGNLPAGLNLNAATGEIFGMPTTAGTSNFSVTVTDDLPFVSAPVALSITIDPAPSITTNSLPNGEKGAVYSRNLAATGGSNVYSAWTLASGELPGGVILNNATGIISGTPTTVQNANFTVTVTDSNGVVSSPVALSIIVTLQGGGGEGAGGFSSGNLSVSGGGSSNGSAGSGGSGGSTPSTSGNGSSSPQSPTPSPKPVLPTSPTPLTPTMPPVPTALPENLPDDQGNSKGSGDKFFLDNSGTWAEKEINALKSDCGVLGYRDAAGNVLHLFRPENLVTQAELITMIVQCKYGPQTLPEHVTVPFHLSPNHWATPYFYKAWKEGIIKGFNGDTLNVNKTVTTAEALKTILLSWVKFADIKSAPAGHSCAEVSADDFYAKYYNFAEKSGVSEDFPDAKGKLSPLCNPLADITRAAVAKLIVKTKGLK